MGSQDGKARAQNSPRPLGLGDPTCRRKSGAPAMVAVATGRGSPSVFGGDGGSGNGSGSTTTSWTKSTTPAHIAWVSREFSSNDQAGRVLGWPQGGRAGGDMAARQGTQRERLDGGGPIRYGWLGVSAAYFDLRIVSHGLVLCAVTLPIDPDWEMLQSKKGLLREASHGVAQGKRGRGLVPIS